MLSWLASTAQPTARINKTRKLYKLGTARYLTLVYHPCVVVHLDLDVIRRPHKLSQVRQLLGHPASLAKGPGRAKHRASKQVLDDLSRMTK